MYWMYYNIFAVILLATENKQHCEYHNDYFIFYVTIKIPKKHILKNRSNFAIPPSENKSIRIEMVLKWNSENENYVINYHVSPNP